MSRSYRKTPSMNVVKPASYMKAKFNRAFRHNQALDFPSGSAYRKAYESWNIHDWRVVGVSYKSFRNDLFKSGNYINEESCRQLYDRWYIRK